MIPLIVLNPTDNHIRDNHAKNLPSVADTYKKSPPSQVTAEHKVGPAVRCGLLKAALHSGVRPLPFHQVEAG